MKSCPATWWPTPPVSWVAARLTDASRRLQSAAGVTPDAVTADAYLLRAVELLLLAGDVAGAHQLQDAVHRCADTLSRRYILGAILAAEGQIVEAAAEIRVVAEAARTGDPRLFARAASSLALLFTRLGRGDDAADWAARALAAVDDDLTCVLTARQAQGFGLAMSGRPGDAVATFDDLEPARPGPRTFFDAELLCTRGTLKVWSQDVAGAVADLTTVVQWSRAGTSLRGLDTVYAALAQAEYRSGAWTEAVQHAEVAISLAEDLEHVWYLPWMHAVAACLHGGRGRWALAADHVDAARRAASATPIPASMAYPLAAEAALAWARHDWDAVLRAWSALERSSCLPLLDGATLQLARLWQAEALVAVGRPGDARRVIAEVPNAVTDGWAAELHRLHGMIHVAEGRPREAEAVLAAGLDDPRVAATPLGDALLALSHGHLLQVDGRRRAATSSLRRAQATLAQLAAGAFLPTCDAELAACGVRAALATDENPFGLTVKEQVVAGLVAKGLSNREVAAEVYVSTKAIEYHLANIFAKVGITSRRQLAAALASGDFAGEAVPQ